MIILKVTKHFIPSPENTFSEKTQRNSHLTHLPGFLELKPSKVRRLDEITIKISEEAAYIAHYYVTNVIKQRSSANSFRHYLFKANNGNSKAMREQH